MLCNHTENPLGSSVLSDALDRWSHRHTYRLIDRSIDLSINKKMCMWPTELSLEDDIWVKHGLASRDSFPLAQSTSAVSYKTNKFCFFFKSHPGNIRLRWSLFLWFLVSSHRPNNEALIQWPKIWMNPKDDKSLHIT